MAEEQDEVKDTERQGISTAKELDRIKQEKMELTRRIEALTLRESTLESKAAEIPEMFAMLANRWRAERGSGSSGSDNPTPFGPTEDPVASAWKNMKDTHSPQKGKNESTDTKDETEQVKTTIPTPTSASPPDVAANTGALTTKDGTTFVPAEPKKEKKKDEEIEALRREMYDRQVKKGSFRPGPCSKYDARDMEK